MALNTASCSSEKDPEPKQQNGTVLRRSLTGKLTQAGTLASPVRNQRQDLNKRPNSPCVPGPGAIHRPATELNSIPAGRFAEWQRLYLATISTWDQIRENVRDTRQRTGLVSSNLPNRTNQRLIQKATKIAPTELEHGTGNRCQRGALQ
ncbi:MAG: hypothetical protein IID41_05815 [Planctomycetes bacterium]|nr:hypothetical protein [Planctomycetota bacterium]